MIKPFGKNTKIYEDLFYYKKPSVNLYYMINDQIYLVRKDYQLDFFDDVETPFEEKCKKRLLKVARYLKTIEGNTISQDTVNKVNEFIEIIFTLTHDNLNRHGQNRGTWQSYYESTIKDLTEYTSIIKEILKTWKDSNLIEEIPQNANKKRR